VPWIGGLAWAGYAAGANWQHVQHLVSAPAYIIAGLAVLLVIAAIVAVVVRRRRRAGKHGPTASPGSAGGQFTDTGERAVSASEQRRRG